MLSEKDRTMHGFSKLYSRGLHTGQTASVNADVCQVSYRGNARFFSANTLLLRCTVVAAFLKKKNAK